MWVYERLLSLADQVRGTPERKRTSAANKTGADPTYGKWMELETVGGLHFLDLVAARFAVQPSASTPIRLSSETSPSTQVLSASVLTYVASARCAAAMM